MRVRKEDATKAYKVRKENAIKAYKAFNPDWTCRCFEYEVGKTYEMKGKIQICQRGFHACEKFTDVFHYYRDDPGIKLAEVLCWGTVQRLPEDEDSKICCSKIKIVRELDRDELLKRFNSGEDNTGWLNTGSHNSGSGNTGDFNSGSDNSGNHNFGSNNTGTYNVGHYNTGYSNAGHHNNGNYNFGNHNMGNGNTGNFNSGASNSGEGNIGSWNSGWFNLGNWNSGNRNTGCFNTKNHVAYCFFDKPVRSSRRVFKYPRFLYFDLVERKFEENMTEKEKRLHPEYKVTGGYLKEFEYKKAFRASFMRAKKREDWPEQYELLKALPNFNYHIFEEISGITKKELEDSVKKIKQKGKKK